MKEKFQVYEEGGVREYWLVFPEYKALEIFVLEEGQFQLKTKSLHAENFNSYIFPDLYIDLDKVFEEKKP